MPQSTASDWISLALVLAMVFMVGGLVITSRLPRLVKWVVCLGLTFRVLGSIARYQVLFLFYDGVGDSRGYYGKGLLLADSFRQFDFSSLFETSIRGSDGTQFVRFVSGFVLTIIGSSMFTEFVVFSLFGFVGLAAFGWAFHRAYPNTRTHRYLIWIWLFPSLWYWPSSVGKEALVVMGLGIAVMGFVGRYGRIQWLALIGGSALTFAVRPQVTAVLLLSIMLAQWLAFDGRWTSGKLARGALILVIGLVGARYSMQRVGLEEFDIEGVQTYVETDKARETTGGTSVDPVSVGITGIPMAAVNVLFRPLPWEISNSMVLLSSLEIMTFWAIVFSRRRNLMRSLRYWRSDRFLRLSLAFILLYSVGLGLMIVNIGILARQRIFLFPFVFLLIEADPRAALAAARHRGSHSPSAENDLEEPRLAGRTG